MSAIQASIPPLAHLLLKQGLLVEDQLRIALLEHEKSSTPLHKVLVDLGFVSESVVRDQLAETQGSRSVDLAGTVVDPAALKQVPQWLAQRHHLLPLAWDESAVRLTVAMSDANDLVAIDRLRQQLPAGGDIDIMIAGESEIDAAIDRHYGHELSIDGILHELETGHREADAHGLAGGSYGQPVVRLIDSLLADAVRRDASDLHFEPEAAFLRIRYRIDGTLRQIRALHRSCWSAMAVRIKVMSGMNIAETRAPQDGRISLTLSGRQIDFRVASQPTIHGENIVLRILDRRRGIVPLNALGLGDTHVDALRRMLRRPEGIILVTGPTGSGKTTTLYSLLAHVSSESVNVMTLEDPVEYPLPLVRQTSISEAAKIDFAGGIRSLMRQDPDIILVGEIRDAETAEMALRAAMTGHQVFSTLHSNSAIGAIPRLLDLGIRPDLLAGNIVGIVAQRLVRRLCEQCRQPVEPEADGVPHASMASADPAASIFVARGCAACDFQGYRGRIAIMEILPINDEIDDLIADRAGLHDLRTAAAGSGFRTLAEDGLRRVFDGTTSLDEVARVTDLERLGINSTVS